MLPLAHPECTPFSRLAPQSRADAAPPSSEGSLLPSEPGPPQLPQGGSRGKDKAETGAGEPAAPTSTSSGNDGDTYGDGADAAGDGILRPVPASAYPESPGVGAPAPSPVGPAPARSPLSRRLVRARPFFDARVLGRWEPAPAPLSPGAGASGFGGAGGAFAPASVSSSASAHAADEAAAALPAGSASSLQVGRMSALSLA